MAIPSFSAVEDDIKVTAEAPAEEIAPKGGVNTTFKGKLCTAEDLLKAEPGTCFQRMVDKDNMPLVNNFRLKLPAFFILERAIPGTPGTIYATVINVAKLEAPSYAKTTIYIPSDLPLKQLTGTVGTERIEKHEKHRIANIDAYVKSPAGYLVGTDPEIFVENEDASIIPAFRFLEEKTKTKVLAGFTNASSTDASPATNRHVYHDNFPAEFEAIPGACLQYLADRVHHGLKATLMAARKKFPKARLSIHSVIETPLSELKKLDRKYVELGCAPSENVYGLKGQLDDPENIPYRVAGGHIHLGMNSAVGGKLQEPQVIEIVKSLDAIVAVACVSLSEGFDNPIRRQFYGLPGEYRLPAHGIEYRTLSNFWLIHPVVMHLVFDLARKAAAFGYNGLRKYWKADEQEVIDCIRNCDVKKAREILERNKDIMLALLKATYPSAYNEAYHIFLSGLSELVEEPHNLEKNWLLTSGWMDHSGASCKYWGTAVYKVREKKKI